MGIFRVPLHNVRASELFARVAYRVVQRQGWAHEPATPDERVDQLIRLDRELSALRLSGVAGAVRQFARGVQQGKRVADVTAALVADARRGAIAERRRLLPSYKGDRWKMTPRVTNRGGHTSLWADPGNNAVLQDRTGGKREQHNQSGPGLGNADETDGGQDSGMVDGGHPNS